MKKELVKEFGMRVAQASRSELIVIMYEIILSDIQSAKEAFAADDTAAYEKELVHAGRFVSELMGSLDYRIGLSYHLMSLYIFAGRELTAAKVHKEPERLDGVAEVIETLLAGYKKVSEEDVSGPVMRNTQQVYAGLTYGRGTLNETFIDANAAKRGFIA
ncbi:MAG: flagellar protein FliS [Lachnospiraceae bacterium]|nr:flagellar protein FliS [Lachnospiraceae bacterium]